MVNKNLNRTRAILYTYGACNLKCKYCNIDKNPALYTIDKMLEDSFKDPNYYLKRFQDYFEPWQLKRIECWGGEPFLGMHRIYDLIDKVIPAFPSFNEMFTSTNFSYPQWNQEFWGLMDVLAKHQERQFTFDLQLSCDGPQELNDRNRGIGTTEKCIQVFEQLTKELHSGKLADNIYLTIGFKPTLSTDNIRELQTKEAIIDYIKSFESNFLDKIITEDLPYNVKVECNLPNNASPSPITVELGLLMAKFLKLCNEIQSDIDRGEKIFNHYTHVVPYCGIGLNNEDVNLSFCDGCGCCGTGREFVGFLPDNLVTICNEGFTELIGDYNSEAATLNYRLKDGVINFRQFINPEKSFMCLTDDEYAEYEKKIELYYTEGTTAKNATVATEIVALAIAGQIEEKYIDPFMASKVALILSRRFAYCIKDNYNVTGTMSLIPFGYLKLMLNGALQEVMSDTEWEVYNYDPN